jgi:hypothetical protein
MRNVKMKLIIKEDYIDKSEIEATYRDIKNMLIDTKEAAERAYESLSTSIADGVRPYDEDVRAFFEIHRALVGIQEYFGELYESKKTPKCKSLNEDYYDDIIKFYEENKDTIKNIVSKNGFRYIYKPVKTQDSAIAVDVEGSVNSDTNGLEKDLRKFMKKIDFDFFIQELTSKPLGSVRIHFYH